MIRSSWLWMCALLATPAFAQEEAASELPEVRQLVLFEFLPGEAAEAIRLFRDEALPLYERDPAMRRFRGYREAESPEPLDLLVVSTFRGMSGMDDSNRSLAEEAEKRGTSLGELYGRIGALSQRHRDLFVEMEPELAWGEREGTRLVVLVSLRVTAGSSGRYERLLADRLLPWERASGIVAGSESGRFLLSDGWTHFRLLAVPSLGAWHRYVRERRREAWWPEVDGLVSRRRQMILAPLPELSVR